MIADGHLQLTNGVFGPGELGTEMCPRDGASGGTRLRENTMKLILQSSI